MTHSKLFPNLYVVLVAPAGVGKTVVTGTAESMLRAVGDIYVAPSSLTTASLMDTMNISKRVIHGPFPYIFNSLQVVASEFGVFLPAYDNAFMNSLTKLYDGELYEERRRTGKTNHIKIELTLLSLLAACTPDFINTVMPESAWDQGFASRTMFVYHGPVKKTSLFPGVKVLSTTDGIYKSLMADLISMKGLNGPFEWEPVAIDMIEAWYQAGCKPVPEHARLKSYLNRRETHLMKLSMAASVARSDKMLVTTDHVYEALSWMVEAETNFPEIFSNSGMTTEGRTIEDLCFIVRKHYEKTKRPVGSHVLVNYLKDRVPAYSITKIIEVMVQARKIKFVLGPGNLPAYEPVNDPSEGAK